MDTIDVHDEVFALCRKLGLVPEDVGDLVVTPSSVRATVYLKDENGSKYLNGEEVAAEEREFAVST